MSRFTAFLRLSCIVAVISLCGIGSSRAAPRDRRAEALLKKVEGRLQRIQSLQAIYRTVTYSSQGRQVQTGRLMSLRPGRLRVEKDPPEQELVVSDGKNAYRYITSSNSYTRLPADKDSPILAAYSGMLSEFVILSRSNAPRTYEKLRYIGRQQSAGESCDVIRYGPPEAQITLYVRPDFVVSRTSMRMNIFNQAMSIDTQLLGIEVDKPIADSSFRFRPPAGATETKMESGSAVANHGDPITVPLTLHGNRIYTEASVNSETLQMQLDTAQAGNVLSEAAAKRVEMKPLVKDVTARGAPGETTKAWMGLLSELTIESTEMPTAAAFVVPFPVDAEGDGVFGGSFFKDWIVTFDFQGRQMVLTPRDSFTPPAGATVLPMKVVNDLPRIRATVDGVEGWFTINTGQNRAVGLTKAFVTTKGLRARYPVKLHMPTGIGFQKLVYGDIIRLSNVGIGPYRLARPTAEIEAIDSREPGTPAAAGSLGNEIWERFTLTLDYPKQKAYLVPNTALNKPFPSVRSGLFSTRAGNTHLVRFVVPKSPAAQAGVKAGDVILEVEGKAAAGMASWQVRVILNGEPGTKVRLKLQSPGQAERTATITLREIL